MQKKISRRDQILQALARELELHPGERITTAALAKSVGVSEAALYRHFPSKAKMFEGLIEFIEESIFGLINRIMQEEIHSIKRCEKILILILGFAERNPGITRILVGDALIGENERLRGRLSQFYDRIETQLRQILREGEMKQQVTLSAPISSIANMLLAIVEGRLNQFVRSTFERKPLQMWEDQWELLQGNLNHKDSDI